VIRRLNEMNVPEQSRIWLCPTSVFYSLPLHAMGPIPSDISPPRYFLDLYIPSYTPSLSSLIESRKVGSQTSDKPSMVLFFTARRVHGRGIRRDASSAGRQNSRENSYWGQPQHLRLCLSASRDHPFAHIVCHGILESGKPFDSSFKLHND